MPRERQEYVWLTTGSLVVIAVVAVAMALAYTRAVMIPFVVALFIVSLVSPIQDVQVKWLRFPRIISIIVTLLVVVVVITVVFLFVSSAIQMIVSTAGRYSDSFAYMAAKAFEPLEEIYSEERTVESNGGEVGPEGEPLVPKTVRRLNTKKIVNDLRNYIFNILTNTVGMAFGLISGVFFVTIFVIFLLAGRNPYAVHSDVYNDIVQKIRRYLGTKVAISMATGILVWVSLTLLGLELASVFAVLAFLLNFIPSIGSIIATLLPIPIAVAQFDNPWNVALVVLIPGSVQMTLGNVIEPKLMGEGLNLHPVTILLALSFWGLLWGIVGMFLAAPITAAMRIVLIQFDTLKPVGDILAGEFGSIGRSQTESDEPLLERPRRRLTGRGLLWSRFRKAARSAKTAPKSPEEAESPIESR